MAKKGHPEIYIFLHMGMSPKKIMALGYSKATCYNYNWKYKRMVKPIIEKLLGLK